MQSYRRIAVIKLGVAPIPATSFTQTQNRTVLNWVYQGSQAWLTVSIPLRQRLAAVTVRSTISSFLLGAAIALSTQSVLAQQAPASPSVERPIDLTPEQVSGLLDTRPLRETLPNSNNVVVAGFRVAFVTRNGASARSGSGLANLGNTTASGSGARTITQSANASMEVTLENVDFARMQAIADRAYADFMSRLAKTGKTIVPMDRLRATDGFQKLELTASTTEKPYTVSPVGTAKHYTIVSPTALPLWFGHFDLPLGDKSAFALGNWRALNQLSVDTGAVVIVPQIVIDFADVSSSGNSLWKSSASVGAKSAMSIEPLYTRLGTFYAKIAMAGPLGVTSLREGLSIPGDFGELVDVTDQKTKDSVAMGNALSGALSMLSGTSGTVRSVTKSALKARPDAYEELSMGGIARINQLYVMVLGLETVKQ